MSMWNVVFYFQGGKDAELGGTVWIPLQPDEESSDLPDFTIDNVTELPEVLPNSPKLKRSAHLVKECWQSFTLVKLILSPQKRRTELD